MQFTALTKLIFSILVVISSGTLFAFEVDELRERAKAMRTQAAVLSEQGSNDQARRLHEEAGKLLEMAEQLEANSGGRREKQLGLSTDKEAFQLKERLQDLRNVERFIRDEHARESRLMKVRGEIADVERALNKIGGQHVERGEHRPEFREQIEKLERAGQRLQHLRVAAEYLKLAEEHDLAHKLMTKAEDIEHDLHAAKKRLAAETHVASENRQADRPDLVERLKEENELLRAEIRELKQNANKGQ